MPTTPIFLAFCAVLAFLGADTGELDPAEYLGAIDDGPGGLSAVHYCPGPTDAVQTPTGPRLDPTDPYALHTLTLNSDPTDPGQICSLSCLHKSTRCYVSSDSRAGQGDSVVTSANIISPGRGASSPRRVAPLTKPASRVAEPPHMNHNIGAISFFISTP